MITTTRNLGLLLLAASLSTAFPIYTFTPPNLSTRDSSDSLQQCLSSTGGELSYSTSSNYTTLSSSYNPLFDYKPYVVVVPSSASEVPSIVRCVAAENGTQKLTPKSGGHSYTAYSLGGADGSVVVDLSQLNEVDVDSASKTASVGAGVRLGKLATEIWDHGGFALPHGTCPYVGVGGHALGGGFGFPTRAWGFLLDRITEMDMVDVNGTVRSVSKDDGEDDLWWALRGAGSNNFGIVTRFTFSLEDAPSTTINYAYNYKTNSDCAKALVALQNMTLATDVEEGLEPQFGGELLVAGEAGGDFDGSACQLSGQHLNASSQHHSDLISRFHSQAGITPASSSVKPFTSWLDSLQDIMGSLDTSSPGQDHEQFYAKSLVQPSTATYDYDSALALVNQLNSIAGLHGTGNSISFDFLGPLSYPASQQGSASFNAHDAAFVNQFYSYGFPDNDNPDQQKDVWSAFDALVETAKSSEEGAQWGAYVNYVDARLDGWAEAYYGDGVERLKQIKGEFDAQDVFWFPQGLGSA